MYSMFVSSLVNDPPSPADIGEVLSLGHLVGGDVGDVGRRHLDQPGGRLDVRGAAARTSC